MKEKIAIFTDLKSEIPFNNIITYFNIYINPEIEKLDDFNEIKIIILDYTNEKDCYSIGKRIRFLRPEIPILIISKIINPFSYNEIREFGGFGMIKLFKWNKDYPEKLLEELNMMRHPEYPSGKTDIAVIIPVYNEESRINFVADFVIELKKFLELAFLNTRIYFVNDGSKDNTEILIREISNKINTNSETIFDKFVFNAKELEQNTKKAGTYIEGIKSIEADILLFVDADNSFFIEDISLMINIIRKGYYDIVAGTKDLTAEKRPLIRKILSFGKRTLTKNMLPKGVYDSQTGLKAIKASSAKFILPYLSRSRGLAIDLELMYYAKKLNFRVLQLPVKCIDRDGSHVDVIKDSLSYLKNIYLIIKDSKNKWKNR